MSGTSKVEEVNTRGDYDDGYRDGQNDTIQKMDVTAAELRNTVELEIAENEKLRGVLGKIEKMLQEILAL